MEIWAAIDLSGKDAFLSFGNFPEKEIISTTSFPMKGRDSSELLGKIEECLGMESLAPKDVARWTAGTGPGNYTGLRIVSALVAGIAYGRKNILSRGIPSAVAILRQLSPTDGEEAVIFYPYDKDNVFAFCGKRNGERISVNMEKSGVFSSVQCGGRFDGMGKAFLHNDADRIPEELRAVCVSIPKFPVQNLVFAETGQWDGNSVKDLIYIRPAVNVAPMQLRSEL